MDSGNEQSILQIPYLEGLDQKKEKGRGAFGAVFEVKLNGLPCIAKGLHDIFMDNQVADTDREAIRKKFFDECLLLNKLKHPNIVQFLGIHQRKEDVFLVMEYMHMALDICLEKYPDIPLPFKSSIIQDVSYGLLHLHSLNPPIIHRDLTAANVLLTEGMRAKIADLGVSKMFDIEWLQQRSVQTVQPGALAYMPPEALTQKPSYDLKLDIFSFGALMLYTATQKFPFVYEPSVNDNTEDAGKNHTIQILKRKCWIDKMGENHPFRSLVLQCLQDRPEVRPTAKILSENINSICCRYKKEWRNILELHSQFQIASSDNEKLRSSIIELQKSNAELEQIRSEAESVKSQLETKLQQHVIKEEKLRTKLENQTLEFRDKQKQLEDELYAWLQASEELKMQPCRKDTCHESHDTKPTSKPRQRASTISDPGAFSTTQQNQSHLNQSEMDQSVENSVPIEEQDSSKLKQQRESSSDLSDPSQPPSSKDTSLPNPDSCVKITLQQPLSQPQRKPPGGVAVIPLPLKNEFNDRHDTRPASKPRQRAATLSGHRALSATEPIQSQSIVLQMGPSVENIILPEEQDSSKFAQQQLSRDHDDPSRPTSSKGQDGSMSGSFDKIPQHQYEKPSFSTSRQSSSTFLKYSTLPHRKTPGGVAVNPSPLKLMEKDTFSDNHDIRPVPKPRQRASKCSEHGETQQDRSGMTLPQSNQSEIDPLAGCTMPAEEPVLSKCERKLQLSTNLVDPSAVLPEHTSNISEEPSSEFTASQFQSQNANSKPPPMVKPRPKRASQATS